MRQVLPEIIAAGATPDQVAHAARAIGMFKQAILAASPLRDDSGVEVLQDKLIELAEEYEEQAQLWEEEYERFSLENQELTDPRAPKLEGFGRPILYWHEELQEEMAKTVLAYLIKQWNGGK